jgi:hypothetical protein
MMIHPLLAASVANTLFNDRTAAANATRTRRVRRKSHEGRPAVASDDTPGTDMAAGEVVIRRATEADRPALVRLGTLDSDRRAGEMLAQASSDETVLVAEIDGSIEAALALDDGLAVADPFRPSALHAQMLALRARQLGAAPHRSRGPLGVLHPRTS